MANTCMGCDVCLSHSANLILLMSASSVALFMYKVCGDKTVIQEEQGDNNFNERHMLR